MAKFGIPEAFKKDHALLLEQLEYANQRFLEIDKERKERVSSKIDEHTTIFIKGYGNDKELISCFRELLFNSRELLDSLLFYIHKNTNGRTSKRFLPFAKSLMSGKYDDLNLPIIDLLKTNFTYVFHIRKIRNEIKNKVSSIEYLLLTDTIIAKMQLPISNDEADLIQYLEINNKDQAVERGAYFSQIKLNEYFPEILSFWKLVFEIME